MPNLAELAEIVDSTPIEQAIMVEGVHGIGKSEWFTEHFKKQGYEQITLFLGQMADAGDFIGLPDRTVVTMNGKKQKITEFCPPKWWPRDKKKKFVILLDEANRGKPEMNQCIMDMVLNGELNGLALPKDTRIIAAINPVSEGYYQVEDMDPAFVDRFNKYDFKPTHDEWIDWGARNGLHKLVIGFISRHNDHLDPPVADEYKSGNVYPSRRSWKRVSDIINAKPDLAVKKLDILYTMMLGIVGTRSVSAFRKYVKEVGTGITAGKILTDFDASVEATLMTMNTQDFLHINKQLAMYLEDNIKTIKETDVGIKIVNNLGRYLKSIPAETMAEFFNILSNDNTKGKQWPEVVMSTNPEIAKKLIDIIQGEEENEYDKEAKENKENDED